MVDRIITAGGAPGETPGLCAACIYAQHVPMRSMYLCAACTYAQHVTMRSM